MTEAQRKTKLEAMQPGEEIGLGDGVVARKTKDGGISYGYRYRDHGRLTRRFMPEDSNTYGKAHARIREIRDAASRRREQLPVTTKAPTVAVVLDEYIASLELRDTDNRHHYRKLLKEHFGHLPLNVITKPVVMEYREKRARKVSLVTIDKELTLLSKLWKYAELKGYVSGSNPVAGTRGGKTKEVYHIITPREEALLQKIAAPHVRPIITFALETGCRIGEVLALHWQKVDFDARRILIDTSLTGRTKTGKARFVPLTDAVGDVLRDIGRQHSGPVFLYKGKPVLRIWTAWRRIQREMTKQLGHPFTARIHDMRHTACTRMLSEGISPAEVQMIMGHSNPATTARYTHLAADYTKAIKALNGRRERECVQSVCNVRKSVVERGGLNVVTPFE